MRKGPLDKYIMRDPEEIKANALKVVIREQKADAEYKLEYDARK